MVAQTAQTNSKTGDYSWESDSSETRSEDEHTARGHSRNPSSRWSNKAKSKKPPPNWFHIGNDGVNVRGQVSKVDGRLNLSVNETQHQGWLSKALGSGLHRHLGGSSRDHETQDDSQEDKDEDEIEHILSQTATHAEKRTIPKLNIVVMVIGSRGDIQPFIRIAKILQNDFGHRVRIATHPAFREFVEKDAGLEFFSVGGNPSELMAFMVKNPGLLPGFETIKKGEVGRRRDQMAEMFSGFWRSCVEPSDGESSQDPSHQRPFVADAIISNPPTMIHVHCAERLGIPLHIMFTFPYTPTQSFPHPLANIQRGDIDESYTNFISYPLVELMTWSGLGDLVNDCRTGELDLDPVSTVWAPGQLYRQKVPYTYLWSPGLCPKPGDWGKEINIAGFVFLELASDFKPPKDLTDFLDAGDAPIYIGFGSIVVDDAEKFTKLIFEAVDKAGVRAIVNKGWGGIGDEGNTPDSIFMIDNVPHDWLFPRCKAVVHHGGAGTTAIGLKCAKPTVIVPFFGDQPFWGQLCAAAKVGAHDVVPYKELTADKLAESIKQCFSEESQKNVQKIADSIEKEGDGARNAVDYFHKSLPLRGAHSLRGSIIENSAAAWQIKGSNFRLSPLAAEILVKERGFSYNDLRLFRMYEWSDFQGPGAPITGVTTAVVRSAAGIGKGVVNGPVSIGKDVRDQAHVSIQKSRRRSQAKADDKKAAKHHSTRDEKQQNRSSMDRWPNQSTQKPTANQEDGDEKDTLEHFTTNTEEPKAKEVAKHAAYGFVKPLTVIAQAPMEIMLGIGQGFHNAPRLYGDETVRRPNRISGFKSGMQAAGQEFFYEGSDALTGIFTQPYHGAKERGAIGAVTGIGKGIGGLVLKGAAAVINPWGLAMKGLEKEATRYKSPVTHIREQRIGQGQAEVEHLTAEEYKEALQTVNEGLAIMQELWKGGDEIKDSGLMGRLKLHRLRKQWYNEGATESVNMSKKAMEAYKKDIPVEKLMDEEKKQQQEEAGEDSNGAIEHDGEKATA